MYLGLDVGGTHTDAVVVEDGMILASAKTVTDHADLLSSVNRALKEVIRGIPSDKIRKVNLSTTLSTNAIVEGKTERVGVIVSAGPGIDARSFAPGDRFHVLDGSIDHRGKVIKELDEKQLSGAVSGMRDLSLFAAVTKFSTRNPDHEKNIASALEGYCDFITMGHTLSGQLNFPRRINTAYFNSTVWRIYNRFADAIEKSLSELGISCPVNILKADGGTIPLSMSRSFPVETILSGPAASVMGIIALCDITGDSIILDIGGTTTDIAIFAGGQPLVERQGISFDGKPTLVRSIETRSIGIGGDSAVRVNGNTVVTGPERIGPCMAEGGKNPALIDAMNYLKKISHGDVDSSCRGIDDLAAKHGIPAAKIAGDAVEYALDSIQHSVLDMLVEINSKPVYTIREMIHSEVIKPSRIYLMGGPAEGFSDPLSERFGLPVTVPRGYDTANAAGAALSRTTFCAELFADTVRGMCTIPSIGINREVDMSYTLDRAKEDARKALCWHMEKQGVTVNPSDIDIIDSSEFRMVTDYYGGGRDIRVRCQLRPGVVESVKGVKRGSV